MCRKIHTTSLKNKQFRTFLCSFFLPSFLLVLLMFSFFINQNLKFHIQEQQNTLKILSAHLSTAIDSDLQMSLSYVYNNDISYFYNFLSRMDMEDDLINYYQLLYPYTKAVSRSITLQNENILGFGFYPCNHNTGLYFYLPKYKGIDIRQSLPLEEYPWYSIFQQSSTNIVFAPREDADGQQTLSIIRAAKNMDSGIITGYIVVDISMDFLYKLLDTLSISPNSGILLFSPSGEYLFSTNEQLHALSSTLAPGDSFTALNGDTYNITYLQDNSEGFSFYYLSSRNDLYKNYRRPFLMIILFYAAMILAALIVFRFQERKITASVTSILDTMKKYNAGDTNSQCDPQSCSITEFQIISGNLNQMIEKINLHIANEYKLKMEQQIAEYQALQAEVDPHFLYNTLNLFISLNRIGAKTELENAIFSLSRLFRYTCEHTAHSTVGNEFSFIENYLSLQKIRFDERLEYSTYIEPELENFQIPKLLIQPLVENAIVHALEPSTLTVTISLSAFTARSQNGFLFTVLSVINTGLLFVTADGSHKRVGLKNIQKRLNLYNPNALFFIGGGENKPTKCYILIPIESNEVNELC